MKNSNRSFYLSTLIISVFIFISMNANAQAAFSGGQGGGYASTSVSTGTFVNPMENQKTKGFEATVFPNPLSSTETFKARMSGIAHGQKITVIVTDVIGSRLHFEEIDASDEITISIPHERLTKGIYLITFQHNNSKITRRISYSK